MIRQLKPGDEAIFRAIRLEALQLEPANFAGSLADTEHLPPEEWTARLITNPVFAAFDGDTAVGLMGLLRQQSRKSAHRATLIMVYLRASHRSTGLAADLLQAVIAHAREQGIQQIELQASAENQAALRFYTRMGFAEIGRIPCGVLQDGRCVDDVLMACRIV